MGAYANWKVQPSPLTSLATRGAKCVSREVSVDVLPPRLLETVSVAAWSARCPTCRNFK